MLVTHLKAEGTAILVTLQNASDEAQTAVLGSGLLGIRRAWMCDCFGNRQLAIDVQHGALALDLPFRHAMTLRLEAS